MKQVIKKLIIFASGSGSNAQSIMQFYKDREDVEVILIVSDRENPGVFEKAKRFGVATYYIRDVNSWDSYHKILELNPDLIVLAGYLRKIPIDLIRKFENKIINIHPALLPQYGGKGMYGQRVHEAVIAKNERKSGMTIHFVNEEYDKGEIIAQYECEIDAGETAQSLAQKVLHLEHKYYPAEIDKILNRINESTKLV